MDKSATCLNKCGHSLILNVPIGNSIKKKLILENFWIFIFTLIVTPDVYCPRCVTYYQVILRKVESWNTDEETMVSKSLLGLILDSTIVENNIEVSSHMGSEPVLQWRRGARALVVIENKKEVTPDLS